MISPRRDPRESDAAEMHGFQHQSSGNLEIQPFLLTCPLGLPPFVFLNVVRYLPVCDIASLTSTCTAGNAFATCLASRLCGEGDGDPRPMEAPLHMARYREVLAYTSRGLALPASTRDGLGTRRGSPAGCAWCSFLRCLSITYVCLCSQWVRTAPRPSVRHPRRLHLSREPTLSPAVHLRRCVLVWLW